MTWKSIPISKALAEIVANTPIISSELIAKRRIARSALCNHTKYTGPEIVISSRWILLECDITTDLVEVDAT